MSTENPTNVPAPAQSAPPALPQPAGYTELKAGLPGADPAFLCAQLESQGTLAQAQNAWMAEQNRRVTAARQEADQTKAAAAFTKPRGIEPLGDGASKPAGAGAGDPIAQFKEAVGVKVAAGMNRQKAVKEVAAENPELHESFVDAFNADRR